MDVLTSQSEVTELVLLAVLLIGLVGFSIVGVLIWHEFRKPDKDDDGPTE